MALPLKQIEALPLRQIEALPLKQMEALSQRGATGQIAGNVPS